MRAIHFFLGAGSASRCLTLCVAKRLCRHGGANPPSAFFMPCAASGASMTNVACGSAPSSSFSASSTSSEAPVEDSLQLDDTNEWISCFLQRSVDSGRQSQEAANYFRGIMKDDSDFRKCLLEARRLMGDQDPEKLTRYQQGQFADRLNNYMSGIASDKLRRAHAEEQSTKRYTQDGTPTGDNYWFEAGNMLSSPAVPEYIKDEILHDMQYERPSRSPAFDLPAEEERLAADDDDYAAHLRRQRRRLLSDVDIKPEG